MTTSGPLIPTVARSRPALRFFALIVACLLGTLSLHAQSATGSISGRIFNPATKEYVRNAQVSIAGTNLQTESESDGSFSFPVVPAGAVTLNVIYTGYTAAPDSFTVTAGQTATREINLTSTLANPGKGTNDEPLKLSAFIVSNEREGNAKAIMDQRRNMNISTSVAADTFGDVTEGNVGEFLKFLPGVDVDYVDGISRGPRIGGLDSQYVGVTMGGASVASADAFASYGSTLNGTTGSQARSVGFEQMSISSIESIEVSRTLSADMDANSPAGNINMKPRRAFDRKGRRIDWQFSLGFNTPDAAKLKEVRGWDDNRRLQWRPSYQLDYSDVFFNQRLGIRLSLSNSSIRSEQQYVTTNYNKTPVTTGTPDLRPMVITQIVFTDGPRLSSRANATLTADFKATKNLVLSLTSIFNAFENNAHTKSLTFNASANGVVAATGRQNVLGDGLTEVRTNGLAANTSRNMTYGGGSAIKLTNSVALIPSFEYKLGSLTVDGMGNYSRSKNDYETTSRGTIRVETLQPLTADFVATRPSPTSGEWTIRQTSGPDWSNLANYTYPRVNEEGRFAFTEIYSGETNAKYTFRWNVPVTLKAGGKWSEENRKSDNTTPYLVWAYTGPGGTTFNANGTPNTASGSFAAFQSPRAFNTDMGRIRALTISNLPTLTNRTALSLLFRQHPEQFINVATPDNWYTAYIANHRDFRQHVTAGYGMADTRLGKLSLRAGLRWELTETESKEFDPLSSAEVRAGDPAFTVGANGRATTIPGLMYQYLSRPRITREGDYENFFPSASAKYSITPSLQAQLGYSAAILRPAIDSLAGVWSIDETARVITAPNPNLKPEQTEKYAARLAYYFEPVGSFTFMLEQVEITDQQLQVLRALPSDLGFELDPEYAGYTVTSWTNNSSLYRYRSLELAYNQNLSFLPGVLRTLNVNVSYTRNYANQLFPGVVPRKVSGAIGWSYNRLSLRLGTVWQDDSPTYAVALGRYQRHNIKLDLSGAYRVSKAVSLFFQGRNILNDPNLVYEADPARPGVPAALYRYGNYGVNWTIGVKGNF